MFGFDDAANMGLAAINAGVQIYGQRQQQRYQDKMQDISYEQALRHYEDKMADLQREREGVNRSAYHNQMATRNAIGDQQGPGSSYGRYVADRQERDRSLRYQALMRESDRTAADWIDYTKMMEIQKDMQKSQQTMGMISSLLLQGGSGVGAAFGG